MGQDIVGGKDVDINLDFDEFTIGDLEDLETISGLAFDQIEWNTERLPVKVLKALVYISQRKIDSSFTVEDAARVKISEVKPAAENPTPGDAS